MRADRLQRMLPEVMQRAIESGSPLAGLLAAMEVLHAPAEEALGRLPRFFDPRRTPGRFVAYLAGWVDLDPPLATDAGRLRELTAIALELSQLRGTSEALLRFLTVATGVRGFEIDEGPLDSDGTSRDFHILVRAPAATAEHESLIRRIIELEKPAHVTYELMFERTP